MVWQFYLYEFRFISEQNMAVAMPTFNDSAFPARGMVMAC
jgi:hypothetical protein